MLDQLIPEDNKKEDTSYHMTIREQTKQPLYTTDDKEFTKEEVRQVIESLQPKKAPGPNGITNEIVKLVFKVTQTTMTAIYNACLRTGCFPENCKIAKILPVVKPGKVAAAVRLSRECVRPILHGDLKFHPYKLQIVQELKKM
jgi:hypothetical protein